MNQESIFQNAKNYNGWCIFCNPVAGMSIYETKNFRILLDTFPVHPGHILLSSKKHYGCIGELNSELLDELIILKSKVTLWMNHACIFYEHGRFGACNAAGNKCEHLHLHCLPLSLCLHSELKPKFNFSVIANYNEISKIVDQYGKYLLFENNDSNTCCYLPKNQNVPAHFLRSLLCNQLSCPALASWEEYNNIEIFKQSYDLIHQKLPLL